MSDAYKKQILRDYCSYMIENRFKLYLNVVTAINMLGKLQRFRFRIDRDKVPDVSKCIANLERKLFRRV